MLLGAPDALPHWVGRENILKSLDQDWKKPHCNVTGLIGLGGEGKSSLARRWQEKVSSYSGEFQFNGVLWWNFYNNRNVDEFFATALEFLTKKKQATIIYTTKRRADIVANILETGRYLFVLDGLEVMQYQGGNQYGKIESKVLRNFLLTFASKETDSRTLVTSRVQLLDLLNYASYHEIRLDQLTLEEGRALLKKLGVQAPNAIIDRIVQYWNGHALSLTLVGNYLTESKSQFGFDERYWARSKNKDGYQKIRRILYRYDEFMTFEDRIFLQFFSAFRSSINQAGLSKIIRQSKLAFIQPLRRMTSLRFQEMIERLINRGLIKPIDYAKTREKLNKVGERSGFLEAHPLIREYYYSQIPIKVKPEVNLFLAKYTHTLYKPQIPKKLNTIKPLIDEVHYLCEAAQYDKAYRLYDRIIDVIPKSKSGFDEDESGFLVYKIGAYETELNMLREFFPQGNLSLNPCVSKLPDRVTVLVSVGLDVSFLGEPHTAISINRRAGQLAIQCGERKHATWAYQNIADDYAKIGRLHDGIPVCKKEIKLAEHFNGSLTEKSGGFMRLGWIYFLLGNVGAAERSFATAEALRPKNDPDPIPWTWSYGEGIWFATYLARTGQFKKASTVSKANLHYSTIDEEQDSIIGCLRSLGDIYRLQGKLQTAINLYSKAIKLASANGLGEEITLAYLGRGLMFMDSGETDESQIDLEQALDASISFGYRLWEFDVRNALIKLSVLRNLNNVSLLSTLTQDVHKILSAAQKHNYKWAEGDAYQCLGRIALQQRDYITGKEYLSRALQIREKTRDVRLPETLTAVEMLNI